MDTNNIINLLKSSIINHKQIIQSGFITFISYWCLGGNILSITPLLVGILLDLIEYIIKKIEYINYTYSEYLNEDQFNKIILITPLLHKYNIIIYCNNINISSGMTLASISDFQDYLRYNNIVKMQSGKCYHISIYYGNEIIIYLDIGYNTNGIYSYYNGNMYAKNKKIYNEFNIMCMNKINKIYGNSQLYEYDIKNFHDPKYIITGITMKSIFNKNYYVYYDTIINIIDKWNNKLDQFKKLNSSKLSFVFHGKPGTGKTMIASAIANYINCDLYKLYINNDELILPKLLLNKKYVLLLDDLDILFNYDRSKIYNNETIENANILKNKEKLFYSLMSFLDNNTLLQNCIIIITTNYVDKFDKALFRPGRIDYILEFSDLPITNIKNIIKDWYKIEDDSKLEKVKQLPISVLMNLIKKNIDNFETFIESIENYKISEIDYVDDLLNYKLQSLENKMKG